MRISIAGPKVLLRLLTYTALGALAINLFLPEVAGASDKAGCETGQDYDDLVKRFGGSDFQNPHDVNPINPSSMYTLTVKYADNVVIGCPVHLRSYNGNLVGDTIRAHPGDTLFIRLDNKLPITSSLHPQFPLPGMEMGQFSFNMTNLHTHGLHTSPEGQGDNVLLQVDPMTSQDYRIHIPADHPAGVFWYHAHLHGSTFIQLSSGMAGALVIEGGSDANGGLDEAPAIKAASEKIFVLQQLRYGTDGSLEDFDKTSSRGVVTVNGQFFPIIRMRPGEVQRWRFIHAGSDDQLNLSLEGHKLYEIAADGIALGRKVAWPGTDDSGAPQYLLLGPGYRSEVLVQANQLSDGEALHEYFLVDEPLPADLSLQSAATALLLADRANPARDPRKLLATVNGKPGRRIARIVVEGPPSDMQLPTDRELENRVPSKLTPIKEAELTGVPQLVELTSGLRRCTDDGDCSMSCSALSTTCKRRYMVNDHLFNLSTPPRHLRLDKVSEWTIMSGDIFRHPFHMHVNPFEVDRREPDGSGKMITTVVWKDTVLLPNDGTSIHIRARYTDFVGKFVLHCHILAHEDMGMMELVEVTD